MKQRKSLEKQYIHKSPFNEGNKDTRKNKANNKENWKLFYANIRGIKGKITSLKQVFHEVKPDIGLFTETLLSENSGVNVEGYSFFGRAREKNKGGGVGILVRKDKKMQVSPHHTLRNIEMMWVSINRINEKPLFVGVYYGKQESTVCNDEIQEEMDLLTEEILEISKDGEVIICMDANAKIGLMKEDQSRNGKLIMQVFEECQMSVINGSDKCEGVVTRQNRKRENEKSAIDFVTTTYEAKSWIKKMKIDEVGEMRMRGKNESDHNSIVVDIEMKKTPKMPQEKITKWNMKAPEATWDKFRSLLHDSLGPAKTIMENSLICISERYKKWEKLIYQAAIKSIGKTTCKLKVAPKTSWEMTNLRRERKERKTDYESEKNPSKRKEKLHKYVEKQKEIQNQAEVEEKEKIERRFDKMMEQPNKGGFWKERKALRKDETAAWTATKDENGNRILDPQKNNDNIANYYEALYSTSTSDYQYHPYHDLVKETTESLSNDDTWEKNEINEMPTKSEIRNAIKNKKNGKATTDWSNEMIKLGGEPMVDLIAIVVKAFWEEETAPDQWNEGLITNIWKGKGDREAMENQRGITVSSSVGTIPEEIMNDRLTKTVQFTQAQAGGKKGGSAADQVFIIKGVIALAKKLKREIILTFYDVKKAYDKADVDDMLYVAHKNGFTGKILRLARTLNKGLTARVKAKSGISRLIKRETGGKQGGKLIVPLFAKMMDCLGEDMLQDQALGIIIECMRIAALLYVDDVVSIAEGYTQQENTLNAVNNFAIKHQLEWGAQKCEVMEIGAHKEKNTNWKLGKKTIKNCKSYKYLGEIIMRDGKNEENLKARINKVKSVVRAIMTCAKNDIMKRIEMSVILKLHETVTVPTMLYNSETWTLNKTEKKEIDKLEIYALKKMIGLPKTTPTGGLIFATGTMFASVRMEMKQIIYLQRLLSKPDNQWPKQMLILLNEHKVGWAKQIAQTLEEWGLETDWEKISKTPSVQWKTEVKVAAEKRNRERLMEELIDKSRGQLREKTKTRSLIKLISEDSYTRQPSKSMDKNVLIARAIIMGRYGMLQCAANFEHSYGGKNCGHCGVTDNEDHRINHCEKYETLNLYGSYEKVPFELIYSDDECMRVVERILMMWDLVNGKNTMRE